MALSQCTFHEDHPLIKQIEKQITQEETKLKGLKDKQAKSADLGTKDSYSVEIVLQESRILRLKERLEQEKNHLK